MYVTSFLDSLANAKPLSDEYATWADGLIRLRIRGYLSNQEPPVELVSSVRALVFQNDTVLVMRNAHSTHIIPGGRREKGENLSDTLRRELLEETGWVVGDLVLLGFGLFHHLLPKPANYAFLYPDFLQVVYMTDATELIPQARLADDYEQECQFKPISDVEKLELTPFERLYLEAALYRRAEGGKTR